MSETIPVTATAPATVEAAQYKFVSSVAAMARDPDVDLDRVRSAFDKLHPDDVVPLADRVADLLRKQAGRTGDYTVHDRVLPYLPGQESPERVALGRAAEEWRQSELSRDAEIVRQALARIVEERQPAAAADLKAHAAAALAEREREHGPIVLTKAMRQNVERASMLDIPPPPAVAVDEPGLTLTRRNGPPGSEAEPQRITAAPPLPGYIVKDVPNGHEYYQADDGQLAMRTDAQRIQGVLRDQRTIGAMLDVAAARGWTDVQITGDLAVARDAWVEATARGIKAEGYAPTRDDRHAAEQRRVELKQPEMPPPPMPHHEPPRHRMRL